LGFLSPLCSLGRIHKSRWFSFWPNGKGEISVTAIPLFTDFGDTAIFGK